MYVLGEIDNLSMYDVGDRDIDSFDEETRRHIKDFQDAMRNVSYKGKDKYGKTELTPSNLKEKAFSMEKGRLFYPDDGSTVVTTWAPLREFKKIVASPMFEDLLSVYDLKKDEVLYEVDFGGKYEKYEDFLGEDALSKEEREIKVQLKDGAVHFTDNGGGMTGETMKKVFDSYFTTKEEGLGIGLYMSKIIIEEKMDGKIQAYSQEGKTVIVLDFKEYETD